MKLVFVSPSYYPSVGGVEYVVKSVAERLARIDHEVIVIAGDARAENHREEEVNGVKVVRWPIWSPGQAYHFPRRRSELERFLRELTRGYDVVHVHSVHSVFSVYSLSVVGDGSARVVVTPHYHGGGHTALRRLLWSVWRRVVAKALSKADIVHAVSTREASLIAKHYPHVKGEIVVIPNGVGEDVYSYRWCGQNSDYMLYAEGAELDVLTNNNDWLTYVKALVLELHPNVYGLDGLKRITKSLWKAGFHVKIVRKDIDTRIALRRWIETISPSPIWLTLMLWKVIVSLMLKRYAISYCIAIKSKM